MARRQSSPSVIAVGPWVVAAAGGSPAPQRCDGWEPAADVYQEGGAVVICLELAGVQPETIELMADGRMLVVRGERPAPRFEAAGEYRQVEIRYGRFMRIFEFAFALADCDLHASARDGFLTVRIEPARREPRRIEISGGEG